MNELRQDAGLEYPFAVVPTNTGFSANSLQFPSLATADSRSELLERLREQVALYLLDCRAIGVAPTAPLARADLDLEDYTAEATVPEIVYVEPAPVNQVSLAIQRAIQEEGVSQTDLARLSLIHISEPTRRTPIS